MGLFALPRRYPRRLVVIGFFAFALLAALVTCAYYTFSRDDSTPLERADLEEFDDGIFKRPEFVVLHRSGRFQVGDGDGTGTQAFGGKFTKLADGSSARMGTQDTARHMPTSNVSSSTDYVNRAAAAAAAPPPADTCSLKMENPKLILLWTPFFDSWDYLLEEHFGKCPRCRNCRVTTDRSRLLESDAVVFHARDMSVADLPPSRLPHQRWTFYCLESPPHSDFPGLQHTLNMFNWTMTYRADSDIPSPYGYVSKVRQPRAMDVQKKLERAWANKTKPVAWMSSHCPTHGGRDSFATELRRHIDVDLYGTCGTLPCPKGQTEKCLQEFARTYKFFLAFENSLCKDYITEKFFRTLRYDIIPVVFGGADYGRFSPPGSFIDALSFESPEHLASFLRDVGDNFTLYSSFFGWAEEYDVSLGNEKECLLCSMLHDRSLKPSSYENLREWWVKGSDCKTWKPRG